MKLEVWNAHMSNTLRNLRIDMIELLLLENELQKKMNATAGNDEENTIQTMRKLLETQTRLEDLQEQYGVFWSKYMKKNKDLIEKTKAVASDPACKGGIT